MTYINVHQNNRKSSTIYLRIGLIC